MPYSGITDKAVIAKLDRCVKSVMKDGKSKSSAIAICRASMKKELAEREGWVSSLLGHLGLSQKSTGDESLMAFAKNEDDTYRYVVMMTNKWRDRSRTKQYPNGEIFSEASHKEFISWLDEHPDQAPEWWCWHVPGTARKNRVDFWDYVDGSVIVSGLATKEEAAPFLDRAGPFGVSHQYFVLGRDAKDPSIITKYRSFEWSDLPREAAANLGAGFSFAESFGRDGSKEATMPFSEKKRAYLVEKLGEEKVAAIEKNPADLKALLEGLGIDAKEIPDLLKEWTDPQKKDDPPAPTYVTVEQLQETLKALGETLNLKQLNEVITGLTQRVETQSKEITDLKVALAHSKKSTDDQVKDALAPALQPWKWGTPASSSTETHLKEGDPEKPPDQSTVEWVQTAFGPLLNAKK